MTTATKQRNDGNAQAAPPKPKRDPDALQRAIYGSLRDREVVVRLVDGWTLTGTLRAVDRFALAIQPEGHDLVVLVYKSAIASVGPVPEAEASDG